MRWIISTLLLSAGLGCTLDPIDLNGRQCPCGPGFVCDVDANQCVSGPGDGDMPGDSMSDAGPPCDPLVTATDFAAEWATSNVIRWVWTPSGERSTLLRYEIHVAESLEDLGTPRARVIGESENPELADYVLVRTGDGSEVVDNTMTYDHEPMTDYVGQLVAVDTSLCEFRSPPVAISTTLVPPESLLIFGNEPTPGQPVLAEKVRVVEEGAERYLEYVPNDDPECMSGVCSANIRWSGRGLNASEVTMGEFTNLAYVEAVVANDGDVPSYFSRIWLGTSDGRIFRLEPLTFAASAEYRTYQIPLRTLVDNAAAGAQMTRADLVGAEINQANVGGQWSTTSPTGEGRVRIASITIRY